MTMHSNSHSYGQSAFHLTWNTKYRYKMFSKPKYKNLTEAAIRQAATRHQIELKEICVSDDHVHAIVSLSPDNSISRTAQLLKGVSSRLIFKEADKFRLRYPRGNLWSIGYSYRSVGDADLDTVDNYIKEHKKEQATLNSFQSSSRVAS